MKLIKKTQSALLSRKKSLDESFGSVSTPQVVGKSKLIITTCISTLLLGAWLIYNLALSLLTPRIEKDFTNFTVIDPELSYVLASSTQLPSSGNFSVTFENRDKSTLSLDGKIQPGKTGKLFIGTFSYKNTGYDEVKIILNGNVEATITSSGKISGLGTIKEQSIWSELIRVNNKFKFSLDKAKLKVSFDSFEGAGYELEKAELNVDLNKPKDYLINLKAKHLFNFPDPFERLNFANININLSAAKVKDKLLPFENLLGKINYDVLVDDHKAQTHSLDINLHFDKLTQKKINRRLPFYLYASADLSAKTRGYCNCETKASFYTHMDAKEGLKWSNVENFNIKIDMDQGNFYSLILATINKRIESDYIDPYFIEYVIPGAPEKSIIKGSITMQNFNERWGEDIYKKLLSSLTEDKYILSGGLIEQVMYGAFKNTQAFVDNNLDLGFRFPKSYKLNSVEKYYVYAMAKYFRLADKDYTPPFRYYNQHRTLVGFNNKRLPINHEFEKIIFDSIKFFMKERPDMFSTLNMIDIQGTDLPEARYVTEFAYTRVYTEDAQHYNETYLNGHLLNEHSIPILLKLADQFMDRFSFKRYFRLFTY